MLLAHSSQVTRWRQGRNKVSTPVCLHFLQVIAERSCFPWSVLLCLCCCCCYCCCCSCLRRSRQCCCCCDKLLLLLMPLLHYFRSFGLAYKRTVGAMCGSGEWIAEACDGRLRAKTFYYAIHGGVVETRTRQFRLRWRFRTENEHL